MNRLYETLRLYAVTDRAWTGAHTLAWQVEQALLGGATCVQLREKALDFDEFLQEAIEIKQVCSRFGVPLIINDNVEVALRSGADGVHVGQEDRCAAEVRALIGPDKILGVTAKTVQQALEAQAAGADYLGSGTIFGSSTKLDAKSITLETLRDICRAVQIPVVAIGGINRSNIEQLNGTGICGVAVVSGIFAAEDILSESRLLRALAQKLQR